MRRPVTVGGPHRSLGADPRARSHARRRPFRIDRPSSQFPAHFTRHPSGSPPFPLPDPPHPHPHPRRRTWLSLAIRATWSGRTMPACWNTCRLRVGPCSAAALSNVRSSSSTAPSPRACAWTVRVPFFHRRRTQASSASVGSVCGAERAQGMLCGPYGRRAQAASSGGLGERSGAWHAMTARSRMLALTWLREASWSASGEWCFPCNRLIQGLPGAGDDPGSPARPYSSCWRDVPRPGKAVTAAQSDCCRQAAQGWAPGRVALRASAYKVSFGAMRSALLRSVQSTHVC